MSVISTIEWTDATWNPVRGCTKISPGCKHCYAETFAERFRGVPGHPYEQGFDLRVVPEKLFEPLGWKASRMVFVNSMSDLFHDGVPDDYVLAVARALDASWVRSIRDQCVAAKVPFFFKQWGGVRKGLAGRLLDGRTWDEMPATARADAAPVQARRAAAG